MPPVRLRVDDAGLQPTTRCIRRGALLLQLPSRLTLEDIIVEILDRMNELGEITYAQKIATQRALAETHSTLALPAVVVVLAVVDSLMTTVVGIAQLDKESNLGIHHHLDQFVCLVLGPSNPQHGLQMLKVKAKSQKQIMRASARAGMGKLGAFGMGPYGAGGKQTLSPMLEASGPISSMDDMEAISLEVDVHLDESEVVSADPETPTSAEARRSSTPEPRGETKPAQTSTPEAGIARDGSRRDVTPVSLRAAAAADPDKSGGRARPPRIPRVLELSVPDDKLRMVRVPSLERMPRTRGGKVELVEPASADTPVPDESSGQDDGSASGSADVTLSETEVTSAEGDGSSPMPEDPRERTLSDNTRLSESSHSDEETDNALPFVNMEGVPVRESRSRSEAKYEARWKGLSSLNRSETGLLAHANVSDAAAVLGTVLLEDKFRHTFQLAETAEEVQEAFEDLLLRVRRNTYRLIDDQSLMSSAARHRRAAEFLFDFSKTLGTLHGRSTLSSTAEGSPSRTRAQSTTMSGASPLSVGSETSVGSEYHTYPIHGLVRTKRLAGGIVADFNRRIRPHYWNDWKDGLTPSILAPVIYMYVATLAPTIAFGGLLQQVTSDQMGLTETMMAQACIGVIFAIAGGQPLAILRPTGPVVAFISVVYAQALVWDVPFNSLYAWVAIWAAVWLLIMAVADLSFLIKYVSDFVEDVSAALFATIFVSEAFKHALVYLQSESDDEFATVAVLSVALLLMAYVISTAASRMRASVYLHPMVREAVTVTAPLIALVVSIGAAWLVHGKFWDTDTLGNLWMLDVPDELAPTAKVAVNTTTAEVMTTDVDSCGEGCIVAQRSWVVPFWEHGSVEVVLAGAILGLLLAVLFFVEQNITGVLLTKPGNQLFKGASFHYDLAIVAVLTALCGVLGLPVGHASLPHSVIHLHAHAERDAGGNIDEAGVHNDILAVNDNRESALLVNMLVGLTLFNLPSLGIIPMPVIFGLFLYMGVESLSSNALFKRVQLMFTEPRLYPPDHFIRKMPTHKVHLYTLVQAVALAAVWAVKATPAIAPLFPLVVVALIPLRLFVLPRWFGKDINLLDEHFDEEDEHHQTHMEDTHHYV